MKVFLPVCVLLISTAVNVSAQRAGSQQPRLTRTQTREAEVRLSDLGYWTGTVDGIFDPATRSALVAFQKWEGRPITGKLTNDELEAIRNGVAPGAREPGYEHVEVDVDRQLLLLIDEAGRVRILPVSTGSNQEFSEDGGASIAHTPRGRFVVYDTKTSRRCLISLTFMSTRSWRTSVWHTKIAAPAQTCIG